MNWQPGREQNRAAARPELAAAHAAVDDAVGVCVGARQPLTRTAKAAKDFLTEVDLAARPR